MRVLSRERLPKIVTRAGFGVVLIAAITVAVVAETTSSSSAGGGHASLLSRKAHQRVNHFNVGATHSPKLLRELRGPRQRARAADSGPLQGSATPDSVQATAAGNHTRLEQLRVLAVLQRWHRAGDQRPGERRPRPAEPGGDTAAGSRFPGQHRWCQR